MLGLDLQISQLYSQSSMKSSYDLKNRPKNATITLKASQIYMVLTKNYKGYKIKKKNSS